MNKNSIILKHFFDKIINVGSEISSKNYIIIVLSASLNQEKKKFSSLELINFNGQEIIIDEKVDKLKPNDIIPPINNIFDYLFLETSKKMLRENVDPKLYDEFKKLGLHV